MSEDGIDHRRNRVLDPDLQNSFKTGFTEAMPHHQTPADEPSWVVEVTQADGRVSRETVTMLGVALKMVEVALTYGGSVTVTPCRLADADEGVEIEDAEVIG